MKLTDAQAQHVRSLKDREGRITPALVVEDAKRKDSPLHELFEWNARKAAEAHWVQTAREIIGAVVQVHTSETTTLQVPYFVKDASEKGQGYRSIEALRADPSSARESLIYTLRTASGHLRRAFDLARPLGMENEIDVLLDQIVGVERRVRDAA